MSYSQPQSQSQSYPPYQRTLYDNNQPVLQPGWNSFDGTCPPSSAAAAAADFENYTQFPLDPGGYNDANLLAAEEQIPQSPNYSQYLNFDSMDTGPAAAGAAGAGSSPAVMSQPLFGTGAIAAVDPEQYADFAIKIEQPEPEQLQRQQQEANMSLPTYSPSMNPNPNLNQRDNRVLARTCGAVPACGHILESPDLEMEDLNLGEWYPPSTISPAERDTQLSKQLGADDPRRKPSADDGTGSGTGTGTMTRSSSSSAAAATTSKKPRKRGRKPLADDDDDEAQAQAQARAKQAHSIVERRYRDNLNGKIMQLHRTLSSIAASGGNQNRTAGDYYLDGDETATQKPQDQRTGAGTRVRKSDVMTDAVNYVHQSEVQMRHMENEISRLTDRVRTLEKLVRCEDCVVLKEMVRRSLQAEGQPQAQAQGRSHRGM
ncbi:hypothetical protein G647_03070 [Cladophialophora carrionii CBS 160.54]|uniref:BHLH domain-containing protein n=1 Tax=Cladophialophora carrionii CBS 160.54 TaxID=1279043 RepID=V9DIY1_9EURO|nr:uncharacterized protein G647_03070 [Cladophialophora carrionii CBS 160.54]ETI26293.1 hypothetical protein G647_03070 [Cladophialophora carrionii CBS 160.54]